MEVNIYMSNFLSQGMGTKYLLYSIQIFKIIPIVLYDGRFVKKTFDRFINGIFIQLRSDYIFIIETHHC